MEREIPNGQPTSLGFGQEFAAPRQKQGLNHQNEQNVRRTLQEAQANWGEVSLSLLR